MSDSNRMYRNLDQYNFNANKMPSYTVGHRLKFLVDKSRGKTGFSALGKLVTRNANRSLKKAVRQEHKDYIRNFEENE